MTDLYDPERGLWVSTYNGPPRGGKGTINEALSKLYPGSATDETGLDYRAVVWGMFFDELINIEMSPVDIKTTVGGFSVEALSDYAARRYEIVDEYGTSAMYTPEINDTVPLLGETDVVREAVKGGFVRRLKQKVNDTDIGILFVDGRNLEPLISKVVGAKIILSTFVVCSNDTAAERETAREKDQLAKRGIVMTPDEEESFHFKSLTSIAGRRKRDEERLNDPVLPHENAMQYWHNTHIIARTAEHHARRYGMTVTQARRSLSGENYYRGGRIGVGAKAYQESRQVVFDTNPVDKTEMILRARDTLEEAFEVAA